MHHFLAHYLRNRARISVTLGRFFHTTGLLVGTFFFAMSLTPTLLPRADMVQGLISGLSLAAGYGVGVLVSTIWSDYLHLPAPGRHVQRLLQRVSAVICSIFALAFLLRATEWQNRVRALMGMEEQTAVSAMVVAAVALLVFLLVLVAGKLFRRTFLYLSHKLQRYVPARVSHLVGLAAAFWLFWAIIDGVLVTAALRIADNSYQQIDALIEPDREQPAAAHRTGSAESLIAWDGVGRQGRRFLSSLPDREQIATLGSGEALEPIRVYVGLNSAPSPRERADMALAELIRVGAFERDMLVLITPTGTGWVDPASIEPLELLQRGNIASVAAQYSYLPSPLSLMSEGEYGVDAAKSLFEAVYGYWTRLPRSQRPALYLHGLSLGAMNSDLSFDFYDIIHDPFQGALWSGPPFRSDTWRSVTERRRSASPAWRPRFRDGAVVRFANQQGGLELGEAPWGSFRIAFLQYASDPVTFFDPQSFYREPDWMRHPRGPDVTDDLRWFPIVTMLQLAADMALGSSPKGYGHEYAAAHYLDAWYALTQPQGWSENDLVRLRHFLRERHDMQ